MDLMDQVAALRWMRENTKAFGSKPEIMEVDNKTRPPDPSRPQGI